MHKVWRLYHWGFLETSRPHVIYSKDKAFILRVASHYRKYGWRHEIARVSLATARRDHFRDPFADPDGPMIRKDQTREELDSGWEVETK